MEQHVMTPHAGAPVMPHPQAHPFTPHMPRQAGGSPLQHYQAPPSAVPAVTAPAPGPASLPAPQLPAVVAPGNGPQESYAAAQSPVAAGQPTYDFIINPAQAARQSAFAKLPGGTNPLIIKIGLISGGLVVVLIIFSILKGLLTSDGNRPLLISVAQHQQSIIHLTAAAAKENSLTLHNKNFALTAQTSLTTGESKMIAYLGKTGVKKVDPKLLALKVSAKNDQELALAATAGNYNPAFQEIMKSQMRQYQLALQAAYKLTPGKNGRILLNDQFKQSELLVTLLAETAATP